MIFNRLSLLPRVQQHLIVVRLCNTSKPKPGLPKNVLPMERRNMDHQENGVIYDKRPFKLNLEAEKTYSWCLCGKSKGQPLCDKLCEFVGYKIKLRPIKFQVEKTGDYWLCNCKQTKHRPFCDGTHKNKEIQETNIVK